MAQRIASREAFPKARLRHRAAVTPESGRDRLYSRFEDCRVAPVEPHIGMFTPNIWWLEAGLGQSGCGLQRLPIQPFGLTRLQPAIPQRDKGHE